MAISQGSLAADMAELFAGNPDAHGAIPPRAVREPVTLQKFHDHLYHEGGSLGIYPTVRFDQARQRVWAGKHGVEGGAFYVRWGCSDIDVDDANLALALYDGLRVLGIVSWIERSKSKGWHVWVFADDWVPAVVMRRALLVAHELAKVKAVEVNPKQVSLSADQLGNYVNLPYPHGHDLSRRVVVNADSSEPYTLTEFLSLAREDRTGFGTLLAAAKLWKEPATRSHHQPVGEPSAEASELAGRLNRRGFVLWRYGPAEWRDRSTTLVDLAHQCRESGLSASDAFSLIGEADARWGKDYLSRASGGEEALLGILREAY